jgi:hypothetical protein
MMWAIEIVMAVTRRNRMIREWNSGIIGVAHSILRSMFWASVRESLFPVVRFVYAV